MCPLSTESVAVWSEHVPQTAVPLCRHWLPAAVGLRDHSNGLSPSPAAARPQGRAPGRLHPAPSQGPSQAGWSGPQPASARRQSTGPPAASACLPHPPSPRPRSCARLPFKAFAAARLHSQDAARSYSLTTELRQTAGKASKGGGLLSPGSCACSPHGSLRGGNNFFPALPQSPTQAPRYTWKAAGSPGLSKAIPTTRGVGGV